MTTKNWTTVAESSFPWEREALEFVRSQFPNHEPYRAWTNFEFVADDGSIYEVDLLVFTPQGFFLIEIKSKPGRLRGDAGTWTWETDGKLATVDNPYQLANSKAKKLRSLLQRQKAAKSKGQIPFIEALVFCSAETIDGDLFDASLRDNLMEFFTRAFRRNPDERFDNAEAMLDAWRDCFVGIKDPSTLSDHVDEEEVRKLLAIATLDTQIPELGLGTRATIVIALTPELASYAIQLGQLADSLALEDPLVPPARVLQRLREVTQPSGTSLLGDARLLRLAAAASKNAAVSSRQELYPRGMDAARALKLSQGAIYGVSSLTVAQIRDRVSGRYPEAAPVPDRTALDDLLQAAGLDFQWDSSGKGGGFYVARIRDVVSITSGSESISRTATSSGSAATAQATQEITPEIAPEIADARQFEERLERGIKEGSFLALIVNPKCYQRVVTELQNRFPVEVIDVEGLVVETLRDVASKANAKWEALVNADAKPGSEPWKKFMVLINRAMPIVEKSLVTGHSSLANDEGQMTNDKRSILLIYPGLLARYEQLGLLEKIRDEVGRSGGLHSCWILIPGDNQAFIDGKPIPIISPGQKTKIPDTWLANAHRAGIDSFTQRRKDAKEGSHV